MSKIVQAVNAMISNQENITKVIRGGDEFFFLYRDKYKWSIKKSDEDNTHVLWYYPGPEPLEKLASLAGGDWGNISMVMYRDDEIGTREASATFAELYTIVKERLYRVNDVLDDIIGDAT